MATPIELGSKVRDKVSGFEGIAVAVTQWIVGCRRITVQPQTLTKEGGTKGFETFDEPMLEVLATPAKTKVQSTPALRATGGPRPEPARRR